MQSLEIIAMVASLFIMFAAVGAKIATAQLVNRMKNSIAAVNQVRQQTLGELRLAQSQKKVASKNKAILLKKKNKLQKKISRLRKELGSMQEEQESRQRTRDTMRGKLIRPTIASPQQGGEESE